MSINDYSSAELQQILDRHEQQVEYKKQWKRDHPSTPFQRQQYNKRHYENRKNRSDYRERQNKYYENNKEKKLHASRHYYYKRTNNLNKLKEKYPETYNLFYNTNVISGLHD